jgi:hypothetical protein
MMISTFILLLSIVLGQVVFFIQNLKKIRQEHLKIMTTLDLTASDLIKDQTKIQTKIYICEQFQREYKIAHEVILQKILDLQHDLLEKMTKLNPILLFLDISLVIDNILP